MIWKSKGAAAVAGLGVLGVTAAFAILAPSDTAERGHASAERAGRANVRASSLDARLRAKKSDSGARRLELPSGALAEAKKLGASGELDRLAGGQLEGAVSKAVSRKAGEGAAVSSASSADCRGAGGADGHGSSEHGRHVATADEIARVRGALRSPDARTRLAALRYARTLVSADLDPDIRAMLQTEASVPVKRVGVQVLALGDSLEANRQTFDALRKDPDAVVRVNAAFGMARAGDVQQQNWLLGVYDASRTVAPRLVPVLGAALEDPAIKSSLVVARFAQIANDPRRDPTIRARAARIVSSKTGS
jgi:hypothetical protein